MYVQNKFTMSYSMVRVVKSFSKKAGNVHIEDEDHQGWNAC
jgi:hypothetical protein